MGTRRFTTTVVGFGALAASLMVLPSVLDASSPQGTDTVNECTDAFPDVAGLMGVKVAAPFDDPEVVEVEGGTITFDFSNPKPDEPNEFLTVTVTFSGNITGVGIVGKAGLTVLIDDESPFMLTFTQGISNVAACFTTGSTTTTSTSTTQPTTTSTTTSPPTTPPPPPPTIPPSTTTTIPTTTSTTTLPATTTTMVSPTTGVATTTTIAATTTTAGQTTTTAAAGTTTTTADSTTTTAAGGSSTTVTPTTHPTTTIVPPPNTGSLPPTGSDGSANVIAVAVLALLGGALALVIARRRAL